MKYSKAYPYLKALLDASIEAAPNWAKAPAKFVSSLSEQLKNQGEEKNKQLEKEISKISKGELCEIIKEYGCNQQKDIEFVVERVNSIPSILNKIDSTLQNTEKIIQLIKPEIPTTKKINAELLLRETWQISRNHLGTVLDTENYDDDANLLEHQISHQGKCKYYERLYVAPKEESILQGFFDSSKRGVIFVGESGIGKSNLMCHLFLKRRRQKKVAVFINARRLSTSNFDVFLKSEIVDRINQNWSLSGFDDQLAEANTKLEVFVDAINEYGINNEGPIELLEDIIELIKPPNVLNNIQIIISCRLETWHQYKERVGLNDNVLDQDLFLAESGNAITIKKFDSREEREALFDVYQEYYKLLPEKYDDQSVFCKELIKQPFMMGLIAETYSNRIVENKDIAKKQLKQKIPKKLNYFYMFKLLTERKKNDAIWQLPARTSHQIRNNFFNEFNKCLLQFSKLLYEKLRRTSKSVDDKEEYFDSALGNELDSLVADSLKNEENKFSHFFEPIGKQSSITVFDMILRMGLIMEVSVIKHNPWGNQVETAYKYFHDQYAQFWLSAVYYDEKILGKVATETLTSINQELSKVTRNIHNILNISKDRVLLEGAIDHWLYANMTDGEKIIKDYLCVLFNELVKEGSWHVKFYVASFLYGLVEKGVADPEKLFSNLCANANGALKKCLVDHIVFLWPNLSIESFKALLDAFGDSDTDKKILGEMSDIFADLFSRNPKKVTKFLNEALYGIEKLKLSLITKALINTARFKKHLEFVSNFVLKTILDNSKDGNKMKILRDTMMEKFRFVLDVLLKEDGSYLSISGNIQKIMYSKLEDAGIKAWNEGIGSHGDNNTFFVMRDGIHQRDMLHGYFKYIVAFHNEDWEELSLEPGSEFRNMTIKMMTYRNASIIGFSATLVLAGVLNHSPEKTDEIVEELTHINYDTSFFPTEILLMALGFTSFESCRYALLAIEERMIPIFLTHPAILVNHRNGNGFLHLAARNIDEFWGIAERILDDIRENLTNNKKPAEIAAFTKTLYEFCFHPNIRIGLEIINYMLKKEMLDNNLWRDCTLSVMAAMHVRNPTALKETLNNHNVDDNVLNNIQTFVTAAIFKAKEEYGSIAAWEQFLIEGILNNIKLRYFLLKIAVGGLAQSNSVQEWSKEFRRCCVELVRAFLSEDNKVDDFKYNHFTLEEAFKETECQHNYYNDVKCH